MQDVHEILGGVGGGRIFNDRRLRAATTQGLHHHHQALKCPRCDSLNTKFCYYNNYNLSQPRHFCKNCRRYWTKGGVLRNVPVGGGCRKSKRSSKRKASVSPPPAGKDGRNSGSLSSSESTSKKPHSSGLGVAKSASEAGSEHSSFKFSDPPPATFNFTSPPPIGVFDPLSSLQAGAGGLIEDGFGSVGQIGTAPFGVHQQNQASSSNQVLLQNLTARSWQKEKFNGVGDDWGPGIFDQTVYVDLLTKNNTIDGALAGPEWHGVSGGGGGHLGMFDLTPGSDWSQSSQWNESDHHLYLPP